MKALHGVLPWAKHYPHLCQVKAFSMLGMTKGKKKSLDDYKWQLLAFDSFTGTMYSERRHKETQWVVHFLTYDIS